MAKKIFVFVNLIWTFEDYIENYAFSEKSTFEVDEQTYKKLCKLRSKASKINNELTFELRKSMPRTLENKEL